MKKILSLILALIMMLSCATMIFAEDTVLSDETPVEVDETASAYYEAVKFLVAYDIMHGKGETLGVYDDIQRYEMALFMGRILTGWTDDTTWEDGTLNSSEFNDLAGTAAENYYGAISYVNQKGVIEGYGNGKFGPTDGITYQDALTMAVRALGYNGLSYPWGYIETAISLGLTDGITGVVFTDTLKREVVAQIVYNALFATNKAGTTLAESVFDLSLAWTNIIITKTDAATDDVPAGYVGFSIFNADGTIEKEVYYVEAAQLGLDDVHDDEKAWGAVYKVMFDTKAEFGLNKVIAYESLELETIANIGREEKELEGYPIQAFLADFDIVTAYTQKNYLNTTPEMIIADGLGVLATRTADNYYAVDWATGNIIYIDTNCYDELWACWRDATAEEEAAGLATDGRIFDTFVPDYSIGGGGFGAAGDSNMSSKPENLVYQYGLYAQKGEGWKISAKTAEDAYSGDYDRCPVCRYRFAEHTADSEVAADHAAVGGWYQFVSYGVVRYTKVETVWYYNADLDMYFQLKVTGAVDGYPVLGVKYMTAAERADLEVLLNTSNKYTYDVLALLKDTDIDAEKAYATLRTFDINADDVADYGVFETYRFGIISNTTVKCTACNDGKGAMVAGYKVTDISNSPLGTTTTALNVAAEAGCKHGTAWISDGAEIVDGSYVIYGYNTITGEIKIVKTIDGTAAEDSSNYVGHGYVRAYNVANNQITISTADGDVKANYNYAELDGSITEAMAISHNLPDSSAGGFPVVANRYLNGFFNQYVEFVMVDDRLVYIELEGASNSLIVVEKYAGIHEDGSIVVWGYEIDATKTATKLEQFRINSYNGWAKGDWYNYSWLYEAEIEAAFTRGTIYEIKSYDPEAEGYNVTIVSSAADKDYFTKGEYTELYYADAKVGGMSIGAKDAGTSISRRMTSSDKYVFIYDIDNVAGYNAIPIVTYTGIVTNTEAYVKGYRIGDTDGQFIFYIDDEANVKGFAGAAEQGYGLVMFLEWGSNAAYDSYTGKNYLVGSTVRNAYVLDLYTSQMKEVAVYPGSFVEAKFLTVDGEPSTKGQFGDGYGDNLSIGTIAFDQIQGYVYQTVNGVIVDDTPVKPSDIPTIFANTVTGTNILTDSLVLETGKWIAHANNDKGGISLSFGHFGQPADYTSGWNFEGFAPYAINARMTIKALGTVYLDLAPYTLGYNVKSAVLVNAIKGLDNGMVAIMHMAQNNHWRDSQGGGDYLKHFGNPSNTYRGDNRGDGCGHSKTLRFFGDTGNLNQAYNYSMIYHSDINASATAKTNNTRAVVYVYDFDNDPALCSARLDNNMPNVDGFDASAYGWTYSTKDQIVPTMKTTKNNVDNVVGWFALGDKNVGTNVYEDCVILDEAYSALQGTFSIAFWFKPAAEYSGDENDSPLIASQDWSNGKSKGFGFYRNSDGNKLRFCVGNNAQNDRIDTNFDIVLGSWNHLAMTFDSATNTLKVYINKVEVYNEVIDSQYATFGKGYGLVLGQDAECNYNGEWNVIVDNCCITSDVISDAELNELASTYPLS